MRFTSIDIGTNTILMLICDVSPDGRLKVIRDEINFPRLGEGVDESRLISQEAADRALEVLRGYKKISDDERAVKIIACGTSALRDAANRNEVTNRIKADLNIDVEVLNGEDEAEWTFEGAVSSFNDEENRFAVIDIGGGSTEITLGKKGTVETRLSTKLGVVRLTERFLYSLPPEEEQLDAAIELVRRTFTEERPFHAEGYKLIGVAGTATTTAAIKLGLKEFDREKIDRAVLSRDDVRSVFETLRYQTVEEITSPIIPPGRADVILAGVLILKEFMDFYHFEEITASTRGLRYGMVLREIKRQETEFRI